MKQKYLLYGTITGLVVLLYFKFGRKKAKDEKGSGSGSGSLGSSAGSIGIPFPTKDPVKNPTTSNPKPYGGECGTFTLYYPTEKATYVWNNGKPTVTKKKEMAKPMTYSPNVLASGYANLSVIAGYFDPSTSKISVAEYNEACAKKQTGNYEPQTGGGGANPNDYETGGYKPPKGTTLVDLNSPEGQDLDRMVYTRMAGAGQLDTSDLLSEVRE